MAKIFFIRHGQASYLSDNYDRLSDLGLQQSDALGRYFIEKKTVFQRAYVGPLQRQLDTWDRMHSRISTQQPAIETEVMEELREHEGPKALRLALDHLKETVPQIKVWQNEIEQKPALKRRNSLLTFEYFIKEWMQGNISVPGTESWDDFKAKVEKGLTQILSRTTDGENVAVITSGGTISAIAAIILNMEKQREIAELNFNIRNSSLSTCIYRRDRLSLLSFNEVPHLTEEMITFV